MSARDRMIVMVLGALILLGGAWLLAVSPRRDQAAKLASQVNSAQSQLNSIRGQLAQGQSARASYATAYAELVRLGEAVPTDDNVPSLIYQLQDAANRSGVDFRGLQLASGGGPSGASSASATQAGASTLPPGATVGPAGLPIEPFTFSFQGNFFHLADFFHRLQRFVVATNKSVSVSGRLMTLDSISLGAGQQGFPQISASISATTFLVPQSQGLTGGATVSGPAASSTQPVSSTSTTTSSTPAPAAAVTHP